MRCFSGALWICILLVVTLLVLWCSRDVRCLACREDRLELKARLSDKVQCNAVVAAWVAAYKLPLQTETIVSVVTDSADLDLKSLPYPVILKATNASKRTCVLHAPPRSVKALRRTVSRWLTTPYPPLWCRFLAYEPHYDLISPAVYASKLIPKVADVQTLWDQGVLSGVWVVRGSQTTPSPQAVALCVELAHILLNLAGLMEAFLRVDFLVAPSGIYFGEFTFTPSACYRPPWNVFFRQYLPTNIEPSLLAD